MNPREVLDYWFGQVEETADYLEARNRIWWRKNPAVDEEIRVRFEPTLRALARGEWRDWLATAHAWCAAIVVLDQMPRNMFRGTPESFAYDATARKVMREGLQKNFDEKLHVLQRVFCYLPFEHSESLEDQNEGLAYFQSVLPAAPPAFAPQIRENYEYALKHKEVIERFGRFPHRNAILGRESTPEEIEFLKTPGSSF